MRKLPTACAVTCMLLLLSGCGIETGQSGTQSQSDSASMSELTPVGKNSLISEDTPMSTENSKTATGVSQDNSENDNDENEYVNHNDFFTLTNGLRISFTKPAPATFDPNFDIEGEEPNYDAFRPLKTVVTFENDTDNSIDVGNLSMSYRVEQNGETMFEGDWVKNDTFIVDAHDGTTPILPIDSYNVTDGSSRIFVTIDDAGTIRHIVYSD